MRVGIDMLFSCGFPVGFVSVSCSFGSSSGRRFTGTTFNPTFRNQYKDLLLLESEMDGDCETEVALEVAA